MTKNNRNPGKQPFPRENRQEIPAEVSLLAQVLDQVSDGIYITDTERNIVFWNQAAEKITGYSQDEVLGKRCADDILKHTDMAGNELCGKELCPLHRAMQKGEPLQSPLTVKALQKDGRRLVMEVSITPLRSPSGDIIGGIEIFRDVSARAELEEKKARFFSSLSHELKTPLSNMQGYLDLLLAEDAGPLNDTQREFLTTAYREEQKLSSFIDELLEMGRFEGTEYSYRQEILDLSGLLSNLARGIKAAAAKKALRLETDLAPNLALFGDKDRLMQAFSNLVGNAVKYTEAGEVNLKASFDRHSDQVVVEVADTGPGIPEEEQEKIFEMFYRLDHHQGEGTAGTGVGLYIVKRVISNHDGRITIQSAPGAGSTFRVYLPGFIKHPEEGQS